MALDQSNTAERRAFQRGPVAPMPTAEQTRGVTVVEDATAAAPALAELRRVRGARQIAVRCAVD